MPTTVLLKLYADWGEKPDAPDLDALWNDLGVVRGDNGEVRFDNRKPLAKLRIAITRRTDASPGLPTNG